MINYLKNLFKKPEVTQEQPETKAVYPKIYRTEINHIISYKEDGLISRYKDFRTIESTDVETLNKQKSEIVDFYRDLNKSIYESLNNTATDYINIGNTIIIKKSDFVNVALEIPTR